MASIHTAANQIAETSTPIEPGDTGEIARNETGVITRAPGPEGAERGGGGGGAIHGDLDGEGGGGEGRERRGEAGWGGESDAGGEEEDHEALAGEQRRPRRWGRGRGGAREPGHRRWLVGPLR